MFAFRSTLTTRMLASDSDLVLFARRYDTLSGMPVDLAYLRRARVRGFFDSGGRMVGGYAINDTAPFRYLSALPISPEELLGERLSRVRECCCIWMDPELPQKHRILVYIRTVGDLSQGGDRLIIGGSRHPGVVAVQRKGLPHMLFEGQAVADGESFQAWVYYGTRRTMWLGALRGIGPRIWKALFGGPRRERPALAPPRSPRVATPTVR